MSRAVLFDVDGVIVHGYHTRPERQRRWDETLEADLGVDPDAFRRAFIHDAFVKHVLVGRVPLLEALAPVLPTIGCRVGAADFVDYWLRHDSVLNEEALDLARALRASGARLYLATNQEHMRADWLWRELRLGDVFEDIFHSARVGALKPTRPYFDWIANRLGPQATPPLFFDDSPDNIRAATAHGWEAVLFDTVEDARRHAWVAAQIAA